MNGVEEPAGGGATDFETGRALWQRCRTAESVEDETEYFLDLAGFADGMLADDDERARVAARLAQDAAARSDVAAARALSRGGLPMLGDMAELVERAIAIDPCGERTATATPLPMRGRRVFYEIAHWSGLAAALAVASWLGFAMGTDTLLNLTQRTPAAQIGDDNFLPELLDPSVGFLRDLGAGQQT
jgi:anti-sigma factor RsiW